MHPSVRCFPNDQLYIFSSHNISPCDIYSIIQFLLQQLNLSTTLILYDRLRVSLSEYIRPPALIVTFIRESLIFGIHSSTCVDCYFYPTMSRLHLSFLPIYNLHLIWKADDDNLWTTYKRSCV